MEGAAPVSRTRARAAIVLAILATALPSACSTPYIGTTAASYLRRVREERDPNIRHIAYAKLGAPGCYDGEEQKAEAVRVLVANLESEREPTASRALICRSLGELRRPEARPALVKAISDPDSVVRAEACRALGKVGQSEDATALVRVMHVDTQEDCRIAAIEGLGELKSSDPRINSMLVQGMEHDDPAIRLASLRALRKITGKDLGIEPAPWREFILAKSPASSGLAASPTPSPR